MTFFDRYAGLMEEKGLDPGSQSSADMMGVTRSAISIWKRKGTTPKGDTVAKMADVLRVSADYLLGRTDSDAGGRCASELRELAGELRALAARAEKHLEQK